MDTSGTFIKMSDCPEIQDGWNPEGLDFTHRRPGIQYKHGSVIWLPRQDQLQEMVNYAWKDICIEVDMKHWRFHYWYAEMQDKIKGSYPFTSMQQLWLAFVMKEKYNKVWDGEDWVKEK